MENPEIIPAVEAENVQAERNAEARDEEWSRALAAASAFADQLKKKQRRKASRVFAVRAVVALVAIAGLSVAWSFGLIVPELALALQVGFMAWESIWLGAWLQFMFADGGLLDVSV